MFVDRESTWRIPLYKSTGGKNQLLDISGIWIPDDDTWGVDPNVDKKNKIKRVSVNKRDFSGVLLKGHLRSKEFQTVWVTHFTSQSQKSKVQTVVHLPGHINPSRHVSCGKVCRISAPRGWRTCTVRELAFKFPGINHLCQFSYWWGMNTYGGFRSDVIHSNCHTGTCYYTAAERVTALEN